MRKQTTCQAGKEADNHREKQKKVVLAHGQQRASPLENFLGCGAEAASNVRRMFGVDGRSRSRLW